MSNPHRVMFSILTSLVLVAALLSAISPTTSNAQPASTTQTASPLSVSGKITSVAKNSFTLAVGGSQTSAGQQIAQVSDTKSMTFMIDKNTTIEGKLKVNANAEVTYREDNGKNIAISVHVTP